MANCILSLKLSKLGRLIYKNKDVTQFDIVFQNGLEHISGEFVLKVDDTPVFVYKASSLTPNETLKLLEIIVKLTRIYNAPYRLWFNGDIVFSGIGFSDYLDFYNRDKLSILRNN